MAALEYMQIHVYYNPHTDTGTHTRVNVNAPLLWLSLYYVCKPFSAYYQQSINQWTYIVLLGTCYE